MVAFQKRKAVPVIEAPAVGSLAEALAAVPDPRRPSGWRPGHEPIPLVALLQQTVVALLCGARSQSAVAQWGRERLEDDPAWTRHESGKMSERWHVRSGVHCTSGDRSTAKVLAIHHGGSVDRPRPPTSSRV